ncbi:hypothetical protein [uncultured Chitinophaga sp.]|uniref:hypothetical protein n=1 Tax=uncultured Chitinophaga sp. TaxID=339340 RepID=UPI0025F103D9|nr:hypothetical protein [uncultured Chitinophaga sp.]
MSKRIFMLAAAMICFLFFNVRAQDPGYLDVLNYHLNGTPVHGVKIKTNLPFTNGTHMPTIIIEGYCYGYGASNGLDAPISLNLTYYIYDGGFARSRVSSSGAYTPSIYLANENNKVVIFLNSKDYYLRFHIKAFEVGWPVTSANYSGWTVADEALATMSYPTTLVTYLNVFKTVGIGVETPEAPLHVFNTQTSSNGDNISAILGSSYNHWTMFGGANGGRIRGSNEGYLDLETNANGTNKTLYLNTTSPGDILMAYGGGNVGIGTGTIPSGSRLAVNGTISAKKIKVTTTGWPDYVFDKAYKLPSLQEVQQYIETHQHLPGIPSAKEVETNGHDLGEMNKKLLEKIEELTLYLIGEREERKKLEEKVNLLEQKLTKD